MFPGQNDCFMATPDFFIPYFISGKDIRFDDKRCISMPEYNIKGTVVGLRLSDVEIRVNNHVTKWYPINSLSVIFYIEQLN